MNIREEIEQKKKELAELEAREQEELAAQREQIRKEYGTDFKALNDAVEAFNKKHGKDYILAHHYIGRREIDPFDIFCGRII